jgi:tRNA-dihydrouridine synthase A
MKQTLSVAPMMDWTDRHCRYFHRLLSPHAWLYTEMVTTGALVHGDPDRHLKFNPEEQPVVLQLGGSDPAALATSAKLGADYGYAEINLNCGCPSDRVQSGKFGACLMAEPDLVAEGVAAMMAVTSVPITVKCRIGIDDSEDYAFLEQFISKVAATGCTTFIIHARKAWLKGLSPKENREIPPLRYDIVEQLKAAYPHLTIILNGGIKTTAQIDKTLQTLDGVMIGREAYQNPYSLAEMDAHLFGSPLPDRADIARAMIPYIERARTDYGASIHNVTKHMQCLWNGLPGARVARQMLGGASLSSTDPARLINETIEAVSEHQNRRLVA